MKNNQPAITPNDLQKIERFIDKYNSELPAKTPFTRTSPSKEYPVGTLETSEFFAIARIIQQTGELVREFIVKSSEVAEFSELFGPESKAIDTATNRIMAPVKIRGEIKQFVYKIMEEGFVGFLIPANLKSFGEYSIRPASQDSVKRVVLGSQISETFRKDTETGNKTGDKTSSKTGKKSKEVYVTGLGDLVQISSQEHPEVPETEITLLRAAIHKSIRENPPATNGKPSKKHFRS